MKTSKSSQPKAINILILAAAKLPVKDGEPGYPVCLTEINNETLLERIIVNTKSISNAKFVYCFLKSEVQKYHLDKVVSLFPIDADTVFIPEQTKGSACTALLAACQLDQNAELLIISANELVDDDLGARISDFRNRGLDAGTLTFHSVHPRYSFVSLNEEKLVIEAAQRKPISSHATTGIFWFARTADFLDGTQNLIRKGFCLDGSYFVAPVFNELILKQMKIGVSPINPENYYPLKSEHQIEHYESRSK